MDAEWSEGVARNNKDHLKPTGKGNEKPVSKGTSVAKNHAKQYSRSGGKKDKGYRITDRRNMVTRATRLAIELHRGALKDLENH